MTRIITRYFEDAGAARAARRELVTMRRVPARFVDLYDSADGLADRLTASAVVPETASAYAKRLEKGGAVLLVRAGYRPLNVAKTTREVTAAMGAADMGGATEEVYVKDPLPKGLSVLDHHPHIFYKKRDPDSTNYHMADYPIPLISRRKPSDAFLFPRHARMADWPIPLLDGRKPYTGSIIPPHARMANWPIPLLSNRKPYTNSIIAPHARMANFPIPLISRRKPYTGSIIARHARMANWPFPHLINGKPHTNSLMPGAPRMANWPISLLSRRNPFTGSIIGRHARMANFPIPLLSRRKPFTGSIIGRHARMADKFLPLVIRRDDGPKGEGFSFSRMLGLRTISRR